jgi:hypothetical protein
MVGGFLQPDESQFESQFFSGFPGIHPVHDRSVTSASDHVNFVGHRMRTIKVLVHEIGELLERIDPG